MKRPLVVLAAGYVLGEVLALQVNTAVDIGVLTWLCAAAAGILWLLDTGRGVLRLSAPKEKMQGRSNRKHRVLLLFLVCLLAGASVGLARGRQEKGILDREESAARTMDGARILVRGEIKKAEQKEDAITLILEDVTAEAGRRTGKFRRIVVYAENGAKGKNGSGFGEMMTAGLEVQVRGKLAPVEGPRNPGEFDFRTYYRTKGTACRMYGENLAVVGGEEIPYYKGITEFRMRCAGILEKICVPEDVAVFKAVLLGDTSDMNPEMRDMYQRNGISHLLAVSGQHLAIIGGGIYLMIRRAGSGYGRAGMISAVLVISYGIMTGSSGSAIRAVIMILCLWLAAVKGRTYDTLSALGAAALILLYRQPYLLYHSGFELSFGAVLAISGLGGWMQSFIEWERAWEKTLLISLCVQIILTPIVLYHYFQHPLYGIFLNLLVIPLVSILMYSGILGIVLGSFWIQGGVAAVGAGHYILRFYELLCRFVEGLPGYSLVLGRPSPGRLVMYFGIYEMGTAVVLFCIRGRTRDGLKIHSRHLAENGFQTRPKAEIPSEREEKPAAGRKRAYEVLVTFASAISWKPMILMCFFGIYALSFLALVPRPVKGLEVVCLDVGQGDGLLLRTGEKVVLIDGGSSSQKKLGNIVLEPYLKSRGISWIDYAVVSHGDSDHINGLVYLLEESKDIRIGTLVLPVMGKGEEVYENLAVLARREGADVVYMKTTDWVEAEDLTLTCLYAGEDFGGKDRNSHSLVLCGDYKGFHMLFTGDMGEGQERSLVRLAEQEGALQDIHLNHAQILKTAHHGSGTSSSEVFLDRLRIQLAVVSYGKGNSYGHPSPETMARLKEQGIVILETGKKGAITLKTDGASLRVHVFLEEKSRQD